MWLTGFFIFALGLSIGSFLNVIIIRTREKRSLIKGRSACPHCKTVLRPYELIPVLGYLLLRGRCRTCHKPISVQYPLVEFFTGLLLLVFFLRYTAGLPLENFTDTRALLSLARDFGLSTFLVIVFVYDLNYLEIPDQFTVPAILFTLVMNALIGTNLGAMLFAGVVIGGFFLAQYTLSKGRWVGQGDVGLGALIGVTLGLSFGLTALFIAYVSGALFGIYLVVFRRVSLKSRLPFGTFLSTATIIVLLFGAPILDWYIGLLH